MVNLTELFNEAKPQIELEASFATFRVTSGPWKHRLRILLAMTMVLFCSSRTLKYLATNFAGEINMNIVMSALVAVSLNQFPLKTISGFLRRKTFYKCLEDIEKSYQVVDDDEELRKISEKYLVLSLKIRKLVKKGFHYIFVIAITLITLQFRLDKSIGLVMDWKFLPSGSTIWNEVPYFLQFLTLLTPAVTYPTADMPAMFIGFQVMASLDILNDYIKLLNEKIKTDPKYLKTILKRHCNVIDSMNQMNEAVNEISFIQMIISTLAMLLAFVYIRKEVMELSGYFTGLSGMIQIFPVCVFGEMIKIKTEKLSTTMYLTDWYELSLKDQKTFLIIQGMSQKQYGVKAAGLYDVNIYAFIQIVKVSISYCAMLYTLSN
ncbi:Odorant receptor [Sergentomyia squamirostris]